MDKELAELFSQQRELEAERRKSLRADNVIREEVRQLFDLQASEQLSFI